MLAAAAEVFDCLFPSAAALGDTIIRQGDEGDNFYIIDEVSPTGADTTVLRDCRAPWTSSSTR